MSCCVQSNAGLSVAHPTTLLPKCWGRKDTVMRWISGLLVAYCKWLYSHMRGQMAVIWYTLARQWSQVN